MSRRKVPVECLFCGKQFESTLRWEGIPEHEYCSTDCKYQDNEYEETYEKIPKSRKDSW